jgi:hypothetical protein
MFTGSCAWAVETRILDSSAVFHREKDSFGQIIAAWSGPGSARAPPVHRYETRLHRLYQPADTTLLLQPR